MNAMFEETAVGLCTPGHLTESEYSVFLGPNAYPELGLSGLCHAIEDIFRRRALSARGGAHDGADDLVDDGLAIVVTRPPETLCICRGKDGKVYFRDSHRKRQFDFDSVKELVEWISKVKSYFVPSPDMPELHNMVGLYAVSSTVRCHLSLATQGRNSSTTKVATLSPVV